MKKVIEFTFQAPKLVTHFYDVKKRRVLCGSKGGATSTMLRKIDCQQCEERFNPAKHVSVVSYGPGKGEWVIDWSGGKNGGTHYREK